jgi:glyoxylase-like metal-dependent hydrolase (beta-lactamase superfamily II)/predicted DCC family thiol-disulfide oxidoreductase YuxK
MPLAASSREQATHTASQPVRWLVFYDDQCEVCQAGVSWIRLLDRERKVDCIPLSNPSPHTPPEGDCMRELHVTTPDGDVFRGAEAVSKLACLFGPTRWIGKLSRLPGLRTLSALAYRWIATNRYQLSKCRGGRCNLAESKTASKLGSFWTCRSIGLLMRLPLSVAAASKQLAENARDFFATRRKRYGFLGAKLEILFLGGWPCDLLALIFGERFTAIVYDGIVVDPGSTRMRASLKAHRDWANAGIRAIVATHHHEEHTGNLAYLRDLTGAPVYASHGTAEILEPGLLLPFIRDFFIGSPEPCLNIEPIECLQHLQVFPAPGHSHDHIVLFDPAERVLLAGDAFMGTYFATPNPDVDTRLWIQTLRRLLELPIEVLVEGHGHVITLRDDVPPVPGLVIRADPKAMLAEKLAFLEWVREQVEDGASEGLPLEAIEASCFPWGRRWSWERWVQEELIRRASFGHFSRTELVRSFFRPGTSTAALPELRQVRMHRLSGHRTKPLS